jgi:hypothetical protein
MPSIAGTTLPPHPTGLSPRIINPESLGEDQAHRFALADFPASSLASGGEISQTNIPQTGFGRFGPVQEGRSIKFSVQPELSAGTHYPSLAPGSTSLVMARICNRVCSVAQSAIRGLK